MHIDRVVFRGSPMLKALIVLIPIAMAISTPANAEGRTEQGFCLGIAKIDGGEPTASFDCDRVTLIDRPDGNKEFRFANKKKTGPIFVVKPGKPFYGWMRYDAIGHSFATKGGISEKQGPFSGECKTDLKSYKNITCTIESREGSLSLYLNQRKPDRTAKSMEIPEPQP